MGNSFQDQFLKAGVIDKQQAQKASGARRKKQNQKDKGGLTGADESKEIAQRKQAEKVERDRELNRQKQEESDRKAIAAQIQQLIKLNLLSFEDGDVDYNFVDDKLVCKVIVPEDIHTQLSKGVLSIVKFENGYEVIPTVVANKISDRDSSLIIPIQTSQEPTSKDDPYADYQVPDDLMW